MHKTQNTIRKVICVIFIVVGIIDIIAGILGVIGGSMLTSLVDSAGLTGEVAGATSGFLSAMAIVGSMLVIAVGIIMLVCGIIGWSAKKVGLCKILGIIILILSIISIFVGGFTWVTIVSIILPIVFLFCLPTKNQ